MHSSCYFCVEEIQREWFRFKKRKEKKKEQQSLCAAEMLSGDGSVERGAYSSMRMDLSRKIWASIVPEMVFVEIAWDSWCESINEWWMNAWVAVSLGTLTPFAFKHGKCTSWLDTLGKNALCVCQRGWNGLIGPKSMYPILSASHGCGERRQRCCSPAGAAPCHGRCWWDVGTLWLWHCGVDPSKCLPVLAENVLAPAIHPLFITFGMHSAVVVICYFCCWGAGVMHHTPKLQTPEENWYCCELIP